MSQNTPSSTLLNRFFSVYFYDGGKENNDDSFKIENILNSKSDLYHSSDESLGLNRSLILEYNGPKKYFTLESLKLEAYNCGSAPLKDCLLFISDTPLDVNNMQKFNDFTKEKFQQLSHEDLNEPIEFLTTDDCDMEKVKKFKKRKYPSGKYLGFLLLTQHDWGNKNFEICKIKMKGFEGKLTKDSLGNEASELMDFAKVLKTKDFSDFVIKVENEEFKVHRSILSVRSEYFEKLFKENKNEAKIEGISPKILELILEYLYTAHISKMDEDQVIDLYSAATLIDHQILMEESSNLFIQMLNKDNIFKLYNEIIIEKSMLKFKSYFIDFFVDELDSVLNEVEFENLDKEVIIDIFKKKEKSIEEILKKMEDSDADSDEEDF
eukprot:gene11949-5350_t